MKLYVYCLIEGLAHLDQLPNGISNAPVRTLAIDDLAVLVSDVDSDTVPVTRENALAHAAVVRSVLDRTTPLPFRFATLVAEQQLRSYVTSQKSALERRLAHVGGCVQMDFKVTWHLSEAEREQQSEGVLNVQQGAGTAFLKEKQRELFGDEHRKARVAELSALLHEHVAELVRDEQIALRPSQSVVLAAVSHLVERAHIQRYRERLNEALESRPELHFLVSGPWPPYTFANIELEFETPFGVSW